MKKPKMILFDYGETLCTEYWGDPLGGCRAVLAAASANPKGVTEEQLLAQFQAIDRDLTRLPSDPWQTGPELRWQSFARYVFESSRERELVFTFLAEAGGDILQPSSELDGGRFWSIDEIRSSMGKGIFTPNFEGEIERVLDVRRKSRS